jgi:hypothetical protein
VGVVTDDRAADLVVRARRIRLAAGIGLTQMAREIGVHKVTLWTWETDPPPDLGRLPRVRPMARKWLAILAVLDTADDGRPGRLFRCLLPGVPFGDVGEFTEQVLRGAGELVEHPQFVGVLGCAGHGAQLGRPLRGGDLAGLGDAAPFVPGERAGAVARGQG